MTGQDNGAVRRVVWGELFPWLLLLRCFRIALQVRWIVAGAAGVLLTYAGWALISWVFWKQGGELGDAFWAARCPWLEAGAVVPDFYPLPPDAANPEAQPATGAPGQPLAAEGLRADRPSLEDFLQKVLRWEHISSGWVIVARPFVWMFGRDIVLWDFVGLLVLGIWSLVVWTFFGGAINRGAAYELATQERLGLGRVIRFLRDKWLSYLAAPVIPLLGILVVAVPVLILGLLLRFSVGVLVAALFWPLALAAGLVLALLGIGLFLGWPLLWSGISAEGTDSYDAIGRAYNYTYQRPVHYLFYAVLAAVLGTLGWLLVACILGAIVYMTYWAASWGSGVETVRQLATPSGIGSLREFGAAVIRFWAECVKLVGAGYLVSYFWTAAAGVYLLLRRDADATELEEVYVEEEPEPLPPPAPAAGKESPAPTGPPEPKPEEQE